MSEVVELGGDIVGHGVSEPIAQRVRKSDHEPSGVVGRAQILEDSTLITADSSGFVHVWSLYTPARLISKFQAHEDPVAAFDVRGSKLVSAGGSILLSDIESGKTVATIDDTAHAVWKLGFLDQSVCQ